MRCHNLMTFANLSKFLNLHRQMYENFLILKPPIYRVVFLSANHDSSLEVRKSGLLPV